MGYDRYTTQTAFDSLSRVYELVRLYTNFFQPTTKLVSKTRHGAKVHKIYDIAQTPCQRLLRSGILTQEKKRELASIYSALKTNQT